MGIAEFTDVEIPARGGRFHVVVEDGVVIDHATARSPQAASRARAGQGRALVPALYDHHHHITASIARRWSCDIADCPDEASALNRILATPPRGGIIRVVGYDERRHGAWTRDSLDAAVAVPTKVQHRSGHMWVLNSGALALVSGAGRPVPRDGRFHDIDPRLAGQNLSSPAWQAAIGAHIAGLMDMGVAGCSDMTAHLSACDWAQISNAVPENFMAMAFGDPAAGLPRSKVVLTEHCLPTLEDLQLIAKDVGTKRQVAVHAVTYEALVLAVIGLDVLRDRLRVEHAFMADDDMIGLVARSGATIGVQPGFILSQGRRIAGELHPSDLPNYQPLRRLHAAGLRMFGGTDAPFAPANPWISMQAAVTRCTQGGGVLNPQEALPPNQAFALFTRVGLYGDVGPPDLSYGQADGVILLNKNWASATYDFASIAVIARAFAARIKT